MGEFVRWAAGCLFLGSCLYTSAQAQPAPAPTCAVRLIQADPDGSFFDKGLEPLRSQLTQPPFSAWHNFRLLQHYDLKLPPDTAVPFQLPGEHGGTLTYKGTVTEGSKQRLRINLQMKDSHAKLLTTTYVINDGGVIMQAGWRHGKGILVLGITCQSAAHKP